MGCKYIEGENPFKDVVVKSLLLEVTNKEKISDDFYDVFEFILKNTLENEKNVVLLDYEIKKKDNRVMILANNAITSFWLSGFILDDVNLADEVLEYDDYLYKYSIKKRCLIKKLKKNVKK
jgi:hypothetical protein